MSQCTPYVFWRVPFVAMCISDLLNVYIAIQVHITEERFLFQMHFPTQQMGLFWVLCLFMLV